MMHHSLPFAPPGSRVGLFGGSFDPVHRGHLQLSHAALQRLHLDRVWWLVSPGNPLKPHGPAPLADRMARARAALRGHPRVTVTGVDATLGTRITADTVARLQALNPRLRFVWLMGADSFAALHRWDRWHEVAARIPIAVFARPETRLDALCSSAARAYAHRRLCGRRAGLLADSAPPRWCFVTMPMSAQSSTMLREAG